MEYLFFNKIIVGYNIIIMYNIYGSYFENNNHSNHTNQNNLLSFIIYFGNLLLYKSIMIIINCRGLYTRKLKTQNK